MATCRKSCPVNLLMRSNLTFDPSFKVKLGSSVFKGPITLLILALEVSNVKPTYRISGPENLLMRSNWTSDPSLKVKLGSSIFNGPISRLILVLEVSNVLVVYRKSCPVNLLMWSNLTFDPSFKVRLDFRNLGNLHGDSTLTLSLPHSLISLFYYFSLSFKLPTFRDASFLYSKTIF